jgi:hypothetical protein
MISPINDLLWINLKVSDISDGKLFCQPVVLCSSRVKLSTDQYYEMKYSCIMYMYISR